MPYKLCPECGQPMLKKGQRRKHPDNYRHARGCPKASKAEHEATENFWAQAKARANERRRKE
jgi:hypothetical protein